MTNPNPDRLDDVRAEYAQTGGVLSDGAVWLISQVVVLREQVQRLSASAAVSVPPPAPRADDRAAVLAEAIAAIEAERDATDVNVAVYPRYDGKERMALGSAIRVLRRMADEAAVVPPPVLTEQGRLVLEGWRFALSTALDLGMGAPWEAIHERVKELCPDAAVSGPCVAGEQQNETPEAERTVAYGDGKGRVFCAACPRPADPVPLTAEDVEHWELCPSCGRHVVDVARTAEPRP